MKNSKKMNVVLWVLQVLLAFWNITGAYYMMTHYLELASAFAFEVLPEQIFPVIGILQILFAVGLVVPGLVKGMSKYVAYSAAGLSVISLLGIVLYLAYSGFPGMLWGIIPAAFEAFIAYRRWPAKKG